MKNLILASVCFSAMLLNIQNVQAQTCVTPPSCYSLGYTKTVSQCSGKAMLKCPLDTSMVFCDNSSSSSGGTTTSCPSGYFPYNDIYPSCNDPNKNKLIEHSSAKGCYTCRKCIEGYWLGINNCKGSPSFDGSGCTRCNECYRGEPMNGYCGN